MGDSVFLLLRLAVIGFLGLLMWAAQRGRPMASAGTLVIRYSPNLRRFLMYVVGVGVPIGIGAVLQFTPPKNDEEVLAIICLYTVFIVITAPPLWEVLRFCLAVTPEGLDCRSAWRGRRFLAWADIKEVSYSSDRSWFVIRARDGWKFHPQIPKCDWAMFLEECEQHLPPEALLNAREAYWRIQRPFPRSEEIEPADGMEQAQAALEQWKRRSPPPAGPLIRDVR